MIGTTAPTSHRRCSGSSLLELASQACPLALVSNDDTYRHIHIQVLTSCAGLKRSGHSVTILEQVKKIGEVGAGIQMAPNNMRILGRFGVLPDLMKHVNLLEANSLRRWKNNEELGAAPLMPKIAEQYKAPLGVIHRGDLQRILLEAAKKEGCDLRTDHQVVKCDDNFEARVQLKSGEWVEGDLVIAADGIKSDVRRQIAAHHNHVDKSTPTGDAAYRIMIPKEKLEHDKEALKLLNENVGMRWMGRSMITIRDDHLADTFQDLTDTLWHIP